MITVTRGLAINKAKEGMQKHLDFFYLGYTVKKNDAVGHRYLFIIL